jgi:HEAT repeat protein
MKNQLLAATILMLTGGLANAALPGETALATIDKALHSKNPDTRREAVSALSIIGSKHPYQDRLEAMLNDKDVPVRLAAVTSLAEAKDAPALRVALDDSTPEVRFAAAKALFNMNDPAARAALIRILKGDSKTASNFIVQQERAGLRTLQTPKPMVVMAVRYSTAFAPVPGAGIGISKLLQALSKGSGSDRAAIALLLGENKDAEIAAALKQALTDKDAAVRAAAIQAIALGGDPAMAHHAEPMLNDKNPTVRLRAAACYLRLSSIRVGTVIRSWED